MLSIRNPCICHARLVCQAGVFIGGGRSHHVKFNTFEACDVAIHFDDRGLSWQTEYCTPGTVFEQELESRNYLEPPYLTAYPGLENIMRQVGQAVGGAVR